MNAGDRVIVNTPGGFLNGRQGVIEQVVGEYCAVRVGENVYMIMDVALEPTNTENVCPTCGAMWPGDRRKGE